MSDLEITEFLARDDIQELLASVERAAGQQGYTITTIHQAVRACRVLEALKAEVERRRRERDEAVAAYEACVAQAERAYLQKEAWLSGLAEGYLRRCQAEGRLGEAKSLSLPGGHRLGWRLQPVDYEVIDLDAFTDWCAGQGLLKTTVTIRDGDVRKRITLHDDADGQWMEAEVVDIETGEISRVQVPGLRVTRLPVDKFSIMLAKVQTEVKP